jgi:hypothetical protein
MFLTDTAANAAVAAVLPNGANQVQLSLHSAFSATGANLIGSKTAATFSAPSGGQIALSAAVDISVPGGSTVRWIGAWDSTGATFKGMIPNGGTARSFQVDLTNNRIYCENHGLANDDKVAFFNDTPPTGLTEGTEYFVVGVTAGDPDYFQVSTTQGGAAIDITGQHGAQCFFSKLVPETYASAGTHRINTFTLTA